jgi:hypothetical protein
VGGGARAGAASDGGERAALYDTRTPNRAAESTRDSTAVGERAGDVRRMVGGASGVGANQHGCCETST